MKNTVKTITKYQIQKGELDLPLDTYKKMPSFNSIYNCEEASIIEKKTFNSLEEAKAVFKNEKKHCSSFCYYEGYDEYVNADYIILLEIKYEVDEELFDEISCESIDVFHSAFWSDEYFESQMNDYLSNYFTDIYNIEFCESEDPDIISKITNKLSGIKNDPESSELFIDSIYYAIEDVWFEEDYNELKPFAFLSIFKKSFNERVWDEWENVCNIFG